jgi:hypothetical protein
MIKIEIGWSHVAPDRHEPTTSVPHHLNSCPKP